MLHLPQLFNTRIALDVEVIQTIIVSPNQRNSPYPTGALTPRISPQSVNPRIGADHFEDKVFPDDFEKILHDRRILMPFKIDVKDILAKLSL